MTTAVIRNHHFKFPNVRILGIEKINIVHQFQNCRRQFPNSQIWNPRYILMVSALSWNDFKYRAYSMWELTRTTCPSTICHQCPLTSKSFWSSCPTTPSTTRIHTFLLLAVHLLTPLPPTVAAPLKSQYMVWLIRPFALWSKFNWKLRDNEALMSKLRVAIKSVERSCWRW
jgi:hypothetical protein